MRAGQAIFGGFPGLPLSFVLALSAYAYQRSISLVRAELLDGYPRLTPEMIRLAPGYAAAYPLRGRPRKQPWRDRQPVHRSRRRLAAIAVS